MGLRRSLVTVSSAISVALCVSTAAWALTNPAPGSAKQVAALVAAAPKITTLPSKLDPPVSQASNDDPVAEYPSLSHCITGTDNEPACVFGDTKGTKTMVLFGDSHAYMWFPAIDAIAKREGWKLVALMNFGCPFADTTVWNIVTHSAETYCPAFRNHMIARINSLDPRLLIVSESFYPDNGDDQPITDAQWTSDLETSFSDIHGATKKVLIGDTYLLTDPIECLAANPKDVQKCSAPEDNATYAAQRAAEQAAAKAKGVLYVNEIPWECSATCTTVVGNMVVYNSAGHISATYAAYLTDVLKLALKSVL